MLIYLNIFSPPFLLFLRSTKRNTLINAEIGVLLRALGMESIFECSTRAMLMTKYNLSMKRSIHFEMSDLKRNPKLFLQGKTS